MKKAFLVGFLLLASEWSGVRAQGADATSSGEAREGSPIPGIHAARQVYEKSPTLPDGVAFRESASAVTDFARDEPEFANAWIEQQMGFDEAISEHLITLFRATLATMAAETQARKQEIGCLGGVPRVYGDNTYVALEQMEDLSEAIAETYYLRVKEQVKNQFGKDAAARLQAWVEGQKRSVVHVKFDQKKLSDHIGVGGDERLERICREFYDRSVAGS